MTEIFILLVVFQIKHYLADYPLQFSYMYTWKGMPTHWIAPLRDHAAVHAAMTLFITGVYIASKTPDMSTREAFAIIFAVSFFDGISHFIIDRWKATRGVGPDTEIFWYYLGIDQMLHHLVGIVIIYILIQGT